MVVILLVLQGEHQRHLQKKSRVPLDSKASPRPVGRSYWLGWNDRQLLLWPTPQGLFWWHRVVGGTHFTAVNDAVIPVHEAHGKLEGVVLPAFVLQESDQDAQLFASTHTVEHGGFDADL